MEERCSRLGQDTMVITVPVVPYLISSSISVPIRITASRSVGTNKLVLKGFWKHRVPTNCVAEKKRRR